MILLPAAENCFLLLCCAICLLFAGPRKSNMSAFYFCIFFVTALYTLTGLITPVTGAIVRYRVPALPFLLIASLLLLDKEKLLKTIPWLNRLRVL